MLTANNTLWAMDREQLTAMFARSSRLPRPTARQLSKAAASQAKALKQVSGKVAVLPLYGIVQQRMDFWSYCCGGTSTDLFGDALNACLNNASIQAVVIDVDSPGGTVYGVQELSDLIYAARGSKPIIAVANSMAASAAYWIATAADQLVITNGGDVGSVGVYCCHEDWSGALEDAGVKVTIIKAGQFKAEANCYEPLTDAARDYLQESVDETYVAFTTAVARNRGVKVKDVLANYGEGRCLGAETALAAGMVDRISTLSQVIAKLTGSTNSSSSAARGASAEVLRLRHSWNKARAQSSGGLPIKQIDSSDDGDDDEDIDDFETGQRVKLACDPRVSGQSEGTIKVVNANTAYGVAFDGMEAAGTHKWYTHDELTPISAEDDDDANDMADEDDDVDDGADTEGE